MAYTALSELKVDENRRDIAAGRAPSNSAALTAVAGGTLNTTWSQDELDELENVIARQGEIELALIDIGVLE